MRIFLSVSPWHTEPLGQLSNLVLADEFRRDFEGLLKRFRCAGNDSSNIRLTKAVISDHKAKETCINVLYSMSIM